jgi:TPR repeat protein
MKRTWKETGAVILVAGLFSATACRSEDVEPKATGTQAGASVAKEEKIPIGDAGRRLYFEKRCSDGHAGLCGELGVMWEKGYGGPKDKKKADEYYKIACDQAVFASCEALGIELKPEKELEILDKNCASGSAFACNNQGQILFNGLENIKPDREKAMPLLEKGCSGGYASSCGTLATTYSMGIGVEKDAVKAKEFQAKAAAAQEAVQVLEAKYLGALSHDELPIGSVSGVTKGLVELGKQQEEAKKKMEEEKAQKDAEAAKAQGGKAPPKP